MFNAEIVETVSMSFGLPPSVRDTYTREQRALKLSPKIANY